MTASSDIFLSYNREDVVIAKVYADAFASAGLNVWWDATLRPGEAYDEATESALRGAKAVVVLWSPRSVTSRWVRAEATIAARNKTLMPVMIEPCERPVMFELTQTVELLHWRGSVDDKAWRAFLDDVRRMVGRSAVTPVEAAQTSRPVSVPSGEGGIPFVALLPLTHRAGDQEMEILAEDLTEEITRELARNSFFKVAAAGTMTAWRGKVVDYHGVGEQLKAHYLVEGKLQRVGADVRLTLQVIDTDTAGVVWSTRFVRSTGDAAEALEEFPILVASQLREHIVQIEVNRAMAKHGQLSGWEHVLRAIGYRARLGSGELANKDVEEALSAIAVAPDFALAHAVLAERITAHARRAEGALTEPRIREVRDHMSRAMSLDGENSAILSHVSETYTHLGDTEAGLRLALRASKLDPHSARVQSTLGMAYFNLGRTADTVAVLGRLDRLGSLDATSVGSGALAVLGICLFMEGEPTEAEAAIDRSLAFQPDFYVALRWKPIIAAKLGKERVAKAAVMQLRRVEPGKSIDQYLRSPMSLPFEHERKDEAIAILRRLLQETEGAV